MTNKHTEKCSTLVIEEMQIATMRYHHIPIKMTKINKN